MTCQIKGCPQPEHTPGPLTVEYDDYAGYNYMTSGYVVRTATEKVVTVDTGHKGPADETAAANATLIARALDMAHALAGLVEATQDYKAMIDRPGGFPWRETAPMEGIQVGSALKAALAAAEAALKGEHDHSD